MEVTLIIHHSSPSLSVQSTMRNQGVLAISLVSAVHSDKPGGLALVLKLIMVIGGMAQWLALGLI